MRLSGSILESVREAAHFRPTRHNGIVEKKFHPVGTFASQAGICHRICPVIHDGRLSRSSTMLDGRIGSTAREQWNKTA
jgi:hypothetical protein